VNYYKHHLGDYAKDTPHLTLLEHGAYRVLMDAYYIAEKPLTLDMERLYAIVRATRPAERKVVDSVLAEFFIKDETGYHHKRIDEELEKYQEKATQNKANGNRGGRPKITQSVSKDEPKNNLSHKPVTNNQETTTSKTGANAPADPEIPDPCAQVFTDGVTLLTAGGESEKGARSLLGKLRRDFGDEAVLEVIQRAREGAVSEPKAFLVGALRPKGARLAL
tara:strand:- start:3741 stop:4403 length:663 start_codon:yes stop_codon:yes gene_type:complete